MDDPLIKIQNTCRQKGFDNPSFINKYYCISEYFEGDNIYKLKIVKLNQML